MSTFIALPYLEEVPAEGFTVTTSGEESLEKEVVDEDNKEDKEDKDTSFRDEEIREVKEEDKE
jgi:hypothetical protein